MALTLIKIAIGAGIVFLTLGIFPNRRWGAVVAIALCIAAAVVLHYVAP
jgi:hypothetical protein